ncbi:MAG TPA: SAM-dependent methyltransferase [Caulobacteraceae bacterium]
MARRLARVIAADGPISIARYMDLCLHDPDFGYYSIRPRLGPDGDFITAPQVSQIFGELLGLWACEVFSALGRPSRVRLVELGPGDGAMMVDVLRAASTAAPDFVDACEIVLLETSAPLKALQARAVRESARGAVWIERFEELAGDAPIILLANEFLDCLPVEQAVRTKVGWEGRRVGLDVLGRLHFTSSAREPINCADECLRAPFGIVREWSPAARELGAALGALLADVTGAALFLDYGDEDSTTPGDTLQAVRAHSREDPLAHPGEADLTARVQFGPFLRAARAAGALTTSLLSQAEFLERLGIEARAATLQRSRPDRAAVIGRQVRRLIAPDQMGDLFKAVCVHSIGLAPPGFESAV